MKKVFHLFVLFLLATSNFFAQKTFKENCGTDYLHLKLLNENTEYRRKFDNSNSEWQKYAKEHFTKTENRSIIDGTIGTTLNIVFHDMTNTTVANSLTYNTAVANLNFRFAATGINFCLATRQLNGDVYNDGSGGNLNTFYHSCNISNLDKSLDTQIESVVQQSHSQENEHFPSSKYINVYVVSNIVGDTAGFAYLPSSHGDLTDGIFIEQSWLMGDTSDINVFVHEMGHYLGLFHVFGICNPDNTIEPTATSCSCDNGNPLFNGDMVADTPPSMLNNNTCDLTLDTCPSAGTDDKSNYMDYSLLTCQDHFTSGQITRMQFMINSTNGPRKSLLGQNTCTDCTVLNNCRFDISPSFINNQLIQVGGSTPIINFTVTNNCSITTINHDWELILLGATNQTILSSYNNQGFSTSIIPNLSVGNYQLTVSVSVLNSLNQICSEKVDYNFIVLPEQVNASSCELGLPLNNSSWTNWERVSYEGGWVVSPTVPYNYTHSTTIRSTASSGPNFDNQGFEISSTYASGDTNFSTIPLPAGVSKIMRVGRVVNNGNLIPGNAYYTSHTFYPTANNCKYRIYYIGMVETNTFSSGSIQYGGFNTISNNNNAAFGFLSQYRFNSPLNSTSGLNTTLGMGENGYIIPGGAATHYGLNDMVSGRHNSAISDFVSSGFFKKMTEWKYQDLDFSEFVNLNPGTEITITFFAHSNDALNSLSSAYAYFAVECLGGDLPDDIVLDLEDSITICNFPANNSCAEIKLPRPKYVIPTIDNDNGSDTKIPWINTSTNFVNIRVSKSDGAGGFVLMNPQPIIITTDTNDKIVKLCLSESEAPFVDFKVEYISLHETLEDIVRVFLGYYHDNPPCTGTFIGGEIDTTTSQDNILWCKGSPYPNMNLTAPCFNVTKYQWELNGAEIDGATDATLIMNSDIENDLFCSNIFVRKAMYIDPYCHQKTWYNSQPIHFYNLSGNMYNYVSEDNDICFNDTYNVSITNFSLNSLECIPASLTNSLPQNNSISVQLYNPNTNQTIGNTETYNFTGNNILPSIINLSFDNFASGTPMFTPTNSNNTFPIQLQLTINYYGCTYTDYITNFQTITFKPAAVGGHIDLSGSCSPRNITSFGNDIGMTYPSGYYEWEFSTDNGTSYQLLSGASNTATLNNIDSLIFSYPVLIRRKSIGTGACADPDYSNVLIINASPLFTPIFSIPNPVCGSIGLPTTSNNGIHGSWQPGGVNFSGNYTFTPDNNQCAIPITIYINQIPKPNSLFNIPDNYCPNFYPNDVLPTTSNNGITGTWSPPTVTGPGVYVFTPNIGQCGNPRSHTINSIMTPVTPFFNSLPSSFSICQGGYAPPLPTVASNPLNFISGTWNPPTISNSTSGDYTFTPVTTPAICALPITIHVQVNQPNTIPTFNPIQPICNGDSVPTLPLISTNNISGSWSPAVVSNTNSTTYTFTPNPSFQCALSASLQIIVIQTPAPTVTTPITYFINSTATPLTATGNNLLWYTTSTGGVGSSIAPTPSTSVVGTTSYYVSQTINGCESPRSEIVVNVINAPSCGGNTITWDGMSWSSGITPTLDDEVIINGNYNTTLNGNIQACNLTLNTGWNLIVTANHFVEIRNNLTVQAGGNFDINDDGSLVQINDSGVNTGNITHRRSVMMRRLDYVYWSSPVTGFNTNSISPNTPSSVIWKWNPTFNNSNNTQGNWNNAANETMIVGKGYIARGPSDFPDSSTQEFTSIFNNGVPHNGIINKSISRGNETSLGVLTSTDGKSYDRYSDNYNLIGNPYPSSIDAIDFLKHPNNNNIQGRIFLWTHGTLPSNIITSPFYQNFVANYTPSDYITYNQTGSQSGPDTFNGKIASGQGFMVLMEDGLTVPEDGTMNVTFNNSMRSSTNDNSNFFRNVENSTTINSNESNRMWLDLVNTNNNIDRTLVGYMSEATNSFDRMFDATLIAGNIYSLINSDKMIIQGKALPFNVNDEIPLGVKLVSSGEYKIALYAVDGIFEDEQNVYLKDNLLNVYHNLKTAPYSFTSTAGNYDDRFKLVYIAPNTTQLISSQCNTSLPALNTIIYANQVTNAQNYNWIVKNNVTNITHSFTTTGRSFQLTNVSIGFPTNFVKFGSTYTISVRVKINDVYQAFGNNCQVTTPNIPITQIQCPSSPLPTINTYINANINNYATAYRFEVKNLTTNQVGHIDRSLRNFMLTSITDVVPSSLTPFAMYNTQYSVKVALLVNGDQGDYSQECIITTPNIPITQIQCPSGPLPTINSYINANINNYATAYRFEVKNLTTNQVGHIDRSLRNFMLTSITNVVPSSSSAFATYNTQYSVKVALLVNGDQGDYSEECIITTPNIPITQIQCPSSPLPTINSYINANINNYATAYRFEVKNLITNQVGHIDRSLRNFMLTSITNVVPSSSSAFATYNTQYSVKVALLVNGDQGDYSEECIIETPSTYSKTNNYVSSDFEAVPIPNPFSNEFSLQIKSKSDELITIKVYDMIGKLLDNYATKFENIGNLSFGRNYPAGFYNIIITQGNNVEKLKIIKK